MLFQRNAPTIKLLWVEESFNVSANAGAHAEYAYYCILSAYYTKTEVAGRSTLVPHASDMTVAATTDTTLAVLSLFPDIVVVIWRPLNGGDCASPLLHAGEASSIESARKDVRYGLMWTDQRCIQCKVGVNNNNDVGMMDENSLSVLPRFKN